MDAELALLRNLRALGVQSASLQRDGADVRVSAVAFFSPQELLAAGRAQTEAVMLAAVEDTLEAPAVRALQRQLATLTDPAMRRSIEAQIDKLRRDALTYAHVS